MPAGASDCDSDAWKDPSRARLGEWSGGCARLERLTDEVQATFRPVVLRFFTERGLVVGLGLALTGSCRTQNPAFGDEEALVRSDSTTEELSSNQDRTDTLDSTGNIPGITVVSSSGEEDSEVRTDASSTESATAMSESSAAQGTTSSATSTLDASICDADAALCYGMSYEEPNQKFPEYLGDRRPLTPVYPDAITVGSDTSASPVFEHFLDVDEKGVVRTLPKVQPGPEGGYGIDITLRGLGCSDQVRCNVSLVGYFGLELNLQAGTIECVGYGADTFDKARAIHPIDVNKVTRVGCFVHGGRLDLYVDGKTPALTATFNLPAAQEVEVAVGVMTSATMRGKLIADIGRVQYWTDPVKFKSTMEALN